MHKLLKSLGTICFLFCGLILWMTSSRGFHVIAQVPDKSSSEIMQSPQKERASWKITGLGEMEAHDGTSLSFKTYSAQDGGSVTIVHGEFSSSERSGEELDFQIQQAKTVIERAPRKDSRGNVIGQRVVALLQQPKPQAPLPAVLWTEGTSLYEILSPSLQVALDWEKKYRH